MKLNGLVVDFYDDGGKTLKEFFPTANDLPDEITKEAHILSPEEREVLRDDAYALILHNNGQVFRKLACVDKGNTLMSALYFIEHGQSLPEEAQKVAAANIASAMEQFGLEIPGVIKVAGLEEIKSGLREFLTTLKSNPNSEQLNKAIASYEKQTGKDKKTMTMKDINVYLSKTSAVKRKRDPFKSEYVGDDVEWSQRTNMSSVQGTEDNSKVTRTVDGIKTASLNKEAVSPTWTSKLVKGWKATHGANPLANQRLDQFSSRMAGTADRAYNAGRKVLDNAMSTPRITSGLQRKATSTAARHNSRGVAADAAYQSAYPNQKVANFVDVSSLEAPVAVKQASKSIFALEGQYPLDSYTDVQDAVQYFDDNFTHFDPVERHVYAVKTAERADELGILVSDLIKRYGSREYAPDVDAHVSSRLAVVEDPEIKGAYKELREKQASIAPEVFADLLGQIDEVAGLQWEYGGQIYDPYFATFGGMSEKEKKASWSWSHVSGSEVTADQLQDLAANESLLSEHFEKDLTSAFKQDPVTIFESLPDNTKIILARLASEN